MEIHTALNNGALEIKISSKYKGYEDYLNFKNVLKQALKENLPIIVYFTNAYYINHDILGFILKIKTIDKKEIDIIVSNHILYNFLKSIEFTSFFNIKIRER